MHEIYQKTHPTATTEDTLMVRINVNGLELPILRNVLDFHSPALIVVNHELLEMIDVIEIVELLLLQNHKCVIGFHQFVCVANPMKHVLQDAIVTSDRSIPRAGNQEEESSSPKTIHATYSGGGNADPLMAIVLRSLEL